MSGANATTAAAADAANWSVWLFNPSLPAAIAGTVVYTLATIWIAYLTCYKYRAWYFVCMPIGGLCQVIGYGLRCYSTQAHQNIGVFATSTSMIVLAPILVAAGNYLLIGRLIRAVLPPSRHRIFKVPARLLTRAYVTLDVICLCVQSNGTGLASSVGWIGPLSQIGIYILLAGLALQVFSFSTYICILIRFHYLSRSLVVSEAPEGWFKVLTAVYISSFSILTRCVFRMVEFAEGTNGYSMTHEWMFWVFEAILMIIALTVFCIWYPSKYLGNTSSLTEKRDMSSSEAGVPPPSSPPSPSPAAAKQPEP